MPGTQPVTGRIALLSRLWPIFVYLGREAEHSVYLRLNKQTKKLVLLSGKKTTDVCHSYLPTSPPLPFLFPSAQRGQNRFWSQT
jgi:hypothetical protein